MPFSEYSPKQKKLARIAEPRDKITGADLKELRIGKVKGGVMCKGNGCAIKTKETKIR
jgi:hypothetical protein